jgi:prolipoprotein diacylglyceryltransferase
MYYAGEVGRRLPVPLFQAVECFAIFAVALWVERAVARRTGPVGMVTAVVVGLWGLSRFVDEYFWLTHDNGTDAVEIASLALFAIGVAAALALGRADRRRRSNPLAGGEDELARSGTPT